VTVLSDLRCLTCLDKTDFQARCMEMSRALASDLELPAVTNDGNKGQYTTCYQSVSLLKRCQPSMLDRWTPGYTDGDGNCMFRAISQAVYGTQDYYMQLRVLACLEVGLHRPTYDKSSTVCHSLLSSELLLPPTFLELWTELTTPGRSCCYVALLAVSAVLQVRVFSYFPPLATFVSPLTMEMVGRDVDTRARCVAVMWSTVGDVPATGGVDINHMVSLHKRGEPVPEQQPPATVATTVSRPCDNSGRLYGM